MAPDQIEQALDELRRRVTFLSGAVADHTALLERLVTVIDKMQRQMESDRKALVDAFRTP